MFLPTQKLVSNWPCLKPEIKKDYYLSLQSQLEVAYNTQSIYPEKHLIFRALEGLNITQTKVVLLGQDPYHGEGQANGLAFSVNQGVKIPPSLRNILKELNTDLGRELESGDLTHWLSQGVLLLNTVLTVQAGKPNAHKSLGWETFTNQVIRCISQQNKQVVFILWGKYAQSKIPLIDQTKHLTLCSPHPSPFSAHKGFFGSKIFSKTNQYLIETRQEPISW